MMEPEVIHIAITRANAAVAIMQFVTRGMLNETEVFEAEPTDEAIEAAIEKAGLVPVTSWRRISAEEIPTDRTFRNAWLDADGRIDVDMGMARSIHRDRLRALRAPLLAELDVSYQRADEAGDAAGKKSIAAQKQALRDVTADPEIDAARTPEELASVMPEALTEDRDGGPYSKARLTAFRASLEPRP